MHYIVNLVIGLIFGALAMAAISPLLAGFVDVDQTNTKLGLVGIAVGGLTFLFCLIAPSVRRSAGRGFLIAGALIFLLPISSMVLSGRVIAEATNAAVEAGADATDQAATAAGVTIGAGLFTAVAGIFGFVVGSIFLLFGLVLALGGTREVVVVGRR